MGVAEVREGEFLFLWPQYGNKCSFGDQVDVFVLRWNKAILLSERRMKTVGTIGRKVLWPFWLKLWACRVEQAGPWEVLRGTLHLLHASGPCTTPVRGCGRPQCRFPLLHVELPAEMEVTQTEDIPGVGKRGLQMARLRHGCLALPGPPAGLHFFLQLTDRPSRPLPAAISSNNSSEPFLWPGPHQVQTVTTLE